MVGRAEALEAINDLLASATIFATASTEVLAAELDEVAGDRLTFTQLKLLRLVDRQGHLTVGDVAALRGDLLGRAEAPGDRRATVVSVTPEGCLLLEKFESRSSAVLLRLLAGVSLPQLRDISGSLDRLSTTLAAGSGERGSLCFRCGLYFRDECLLRTSTDSRCYLHLGSGRRGGDIPSGARRARGSDRARVMTGGIG